jgi:hypothetical protein
MADVRGGVKVWLGCGESRLREGDEGGRRLNPTFPQIHSG